MQTYSALAVTSMHFIFAPCLVIDAWCSDLGQHTYWRHSVSSKHWVRSNLTDRNSVQQLHVALQAGGEHLSRLASMSRPGLNTLQSSKSNTATLTQVMMLFALLLNLCSKSGHKLEQNWSLPCGVKSICVMHQLLDCACSRRCVLLHPCQWAR